MLDLNVSYINNIDFSIFREYTEFDNDAILDQKFNNNSGKEHFKLLAYLSTKFDNIQIVDIGGTHKCRSSLALSYNPTNSVTIFDTIFEIDNNSPLIKKNNIHYNNDYKNQNIFDKLENYKNTLLNSTIIFLDLDKNDGINEFKLYEFLKINDYKGFIICDDVWHSENVRNNFWYKVEDDYKYDITEFGHSIGTGLITFNDEFSLKKNKNENWTLVTAYFNLTKYDDVNPEIKARDQSYYISHSISTLSMPYNMVIYCDEESKDIIYSLRPPYLRFKTKYIIWDFDEIRFKKNNILNENSFKDYREKILQNRITHPYILDPRNNGSYYLFCMSRYVMLKDTILTNPFGSTHFCWINFCMQRMGVNNLRHLNEALSVNRNKFSTVYIDYISKPYIDITVGYFNSAMTSMCSGFFTGDTYYMYKVCDLIEDKFLQYLEMGHGHADEQLYSPVYFENKDLFEHYYGDYTEMITNYVYAYEQPEKIIWFFISHSFECKDYQKCFDACNFLLKSIMNKKTKLSDNDIRILSYYYMICDLSLRNNGNLTWIILPKGTR